MPFRREVKRLGYMEDLTESLNNSLSTLNRVEVNLDTLNEIDRREISMIDAECDFYIRRMGGE